MIARRHPGAHFSFTTMTGLLRAVLREITATLVIPGVLVTVLPTRGRTAPSAAQPRGLSFELTRSTFLNVDVSPDGRAVVFDLLGDLYLMPITGGAATPLLAGPDWDQAPRFSPDGTMAAFVSDRSGIENIWVVSLATHRPTQITDSDKPVAGTPSWSSDGRELLFGTRGVASGLQVVTVDSHEVRPLEAHPAGALADALFTYNYVAATSGVAGRDGVVFFSEIHVVHPRPGFQHGSRSVLVRFDPRDASRRTLTNLAQAHDESKPQLSVSGRLLAYYRAQDGVTELRLRDLETGGDRLLVEVPDADDPYRWGDRGDPMPTFAFTPDERALVVGTGGRMYRVSISDGQPTEIPFRASATFDIPPRAAARRRIKDGPLDVRAIRWPSFSRDGRRAAFSALGSIWTQELPGGEPRRVNASATFDHMPAISPDGRSVLYVSHDLHAAHGKVVLAAVDGGAQRTLLGGAFEYFAPAWSPDGKKIAFVRSGRPSGPQRDPRSSVLEYGWLDLQQGTTTVAAVLPKGPVLPSPFAVHVSFSENGQELLCTGQPELTRIAVFAATLDGSSRRTIATGGRDVLGAISSNDGRRVAFVGWNGDLWLAMQEPGAPPVTLRPDPAHATPIGNDATTSLTWRDSGALFVASSRAVAQLAAPDWTPRAVTTFHLEAPRHESRATLALVNARVISVAGDRGAGPIVERATVIVRGRRIAAVGPASQVEVPRDARVIDVAGMTLLPGFHDAHYHWIGQDAGFRPREDPSAIPFGLTSAWDAISGYGDMGQAAEEMRGAGRLRGPRAFFAGRSVEHAGGQVRGPEDAQRSARMHGTLGVDLLKDYNVLSRRTRRWFADAARAEGLGIVGHFEGLGQALSRVMDGYTGIDHPRFSVPLEQDVLQLLARTKTILTPQVQLADGTSSLDDEPLRLYFAEVQRRKPDRLARIQRYTSNSTYVKWMTPTDKPLERMRAFKVAQACAALVRAGGSIAVSGHNAPAVLVHAEMWLLWRGGVAPEEIIRAATRTGIEKAGYLDDLGSIEPGKIADLVILGSDPLADVLNTIDVRYTVVDGVVYDADTGTEIPPPTLDQRVGALPGSR